ncbi:MAG: hypothetical protein KIT27_07490 [Legionellales bacterium]|nr:hypothetical protein [Legionellales bacterium]
MGKFIFTTVAGLLLTTTVFAVSSHPSTTGQKCHSAEVKFQGNYIQLNSTNAENSRTHLYLLHNTSDKSFTFDHPMTHTGASAGWASNLKPNFWSAIVVNKPNFQLSCNASSTATEKKDHAELSCKEMVKVCELTTVKIPDSQAGTYWYAENQSYQSLLSAIEKRLQQPAQPH